MLQRIQSVWFFLASVVILALFLFPFMQFADANGAAYAWKVSGLYGYVDGQVTRLENAWWLLALTILAAAFPLYLIFQFRDRKKQIRLSILAVAFVLLLGAGLYVIMQQTWSTYNLAFSSGQIGFGTVLLPVSIVLLFMARAGVRKDEKLIRSADRLR